MSWTVIGQELAIRTLSSAIRDGRVSHAYLFAGPNHVGKTLTGLQFAQALNCIGEDPPCGRCRQCGRIGSHSHPDVELIGIGGLCLAPAGVAHDHKADNSRDIKICQVRRIEQIVSRAPFDAGYRVLIIEPGHALNEPAQNALLKTLEEAPSNVVLILITDREELLLDTIRSRARRVPFGGLPKAAIERALRDRWDVEPGRAAELAQLSSGRLGWTVAALQNEALLESRAASLAAAEAMAAAPLAERFAYAGSLGGSYTKDRQGVQATLDLWESFWRDLLMIAAGREHEATNRDRLDALRPLAAQCGVAPAVRALRAIVEARQQLDENASPVLALEVMMLALPQLGATTAVRS
jgi:DNA polymerase-3 subunit delta'